jgi:hypothetical protein
VLSVTNACRPIFICGSLSRDGQIASYRAKRRGCQDLTGPDNI